MTGKLINSLRLISIIVLFIAYMLAYASVPERVLISVDEVGNAQLFMSKSTLFYAGLTFMIIVNLVLFILLRLIRKGQTELSAVLYGWLSVLAILINIFFAFTASFIAVLNSRENFDYSSFGYIVYVIGGMFVIWLVGLIYTLLKAR